LDLSKCFNCGQLIKPFCSDEEALQIARSLHEKEPDSFAYKMQYESIKRKIQEVGDLMGLATQSEIDKAVIEAKKKLRDDEIMDVLKKCSYGGKPVTMDLKVGEKLEPSANKRIP
jgi:hypothetical protein